MAGKDLKKVHQFLKDVGTYYLATEDGDTPRVRPFGTALFIYSFTEEPQVLDVICCEL